MAQKLSIFKQVCAIVKPETFSPSVSPILPTSVLPVKALPTAFPAMDLENILRLIQELELEEILTKTSEKEEPWTFPVLSSMMQVDTAIHWKIWLLILRVAASSPFGLPVISHLPTSEHLLPLPITEKKSLT